MECLLGIKFNDFVLIAADRTAAHSIMVMKSGENELQKSNFLELFLDFKLKTRTNCINSRTNW